MPISRSIDFCQQRYVPESHAGYPRNRVDLLGKLVGVDKNNHPSIARQPRFQLLHAGTDRLGQHIQQSNGLLNVSLAQRVIEESRDVQSPQHRRIAARFGQSCDALLAWAGYEGAKFGFKQVDLASDHHADAPWIELTRIGRLNRED